jgi:glycosyltransferase involved in cell wall biosynthesis
MSRRRTIVIVNDNARATGGASVVAIASARELARRGNPVELFTGVGPVSAELRDVPGLNVTCLGQHEILHDPNRVRAIVNGVANFPARAAFARLLDRLDPRETIVHVHLWTKGLSPLVIHEAIRREFPVAITLHDFFITCPNGGFYVHADSSLCARRPLSPECLTCSCDRRSFGQKIWRTARTILQNEVLAINRRATHFIGVSDHSINLMRSHLPEHVPVTIVRNPIDLPDLGPAPVGDNDTFLFIGRFNPEKGVLLAAEAGREMASRMMFLGDGDLRGEAERLAPGATFTGWLSPQEVLARIRKARALIFPPLWYETLGLVVVEAASQGVPAIIADHCAATDYVVPGKTGLLFRRGSAEDLRRRLREMDEPGKAAALGRNAYDWYWRDPWTLERHAQELETVYDRIAGRVPVPVAA